MEAGGTVTCVLFLMDASGKFVGGDDFKFEPEITNEGVKIRNVETSFLEEGQYEFRFKPFKVGKAALTLKTAGNKPIGEKTEIAVTAGAVVLADHVAAATSDHR